MKILLNPKGLGLVLLRFVVFVLYYRLVVLYHVCLNQGRWPKIAYNLQKPMKVKQFLSLSEMGSYLEPWY